MEDLRKAMPSISHVLRKLHTIPDNNKLITLLQFWLAITRIPEYKTLLHFRISCYKLTSFNTGDQLERLLILESEFGTLPGFTPALDVVIEFLTTVRSMIIVLVACSGIPFQDAIGFLLFVSFDVQKPTGSIISCLVFSVTIISYKTL